MANPVTNSYISSRPMASARDANTSIDARITGAPQKRFYVDASFNSFTGNLELLTLKISFNEQILTEAENVRTIAPQLNGITWANPPFPLLTQTELINERSYCASGRNLPTNCNTRQCQCPQIFEAQNGELVEVVLADPRNKTTFSSKFG